MVVLGLDGDTASTLDVEADTVWLAAAGDVARIVIRRDDLDEFTRTGTSQLLLADATAAGVGPVASWSTTAPSGSTPATG